MKKEILIKEVLSMKEKRKDEKGNGESREEEKEKITKKEGF